MIEEQKLAEQLVEALLRDPPAGMSTAQITAWIRSHGAALRQIVQRACREQSRGHYYSVGGTWYVDSRFLQSVMENYESLPIESDWRVLLPAGGLRCQVVTGQPRLPDQVGPLYTCGAEGDAKLPSVLHTWATDDGLATLAGEWDAWPGPSGPACGDTCACKGCKKPKHDHATPWGEAVAPTTIRDLIKQASKAIKDDHLEENREFTETLERALVHQTKEPERRLLRAALDVYSVRGEHGAFEEELHAGVAQALWGIALAWSDIQQITPPWYEGEDDEGT